MLPHLQCHSFSFFALSEFLETEEIKQYFMKMIGKDMLEVKALFVPTAAIDAGAIAVLPKCMNDYLIELCEAFLQYF